MSSSTWLNFLCLYNDTRLICALMNPISSNILSLLALLLLLWYCYACVLLVFKMWDSLKLELVILERLTKTGKRASLGVFHMASSCQEVVVESTVVTSDPGKLQGFQQLVFWAFLKIKEPISTVLPSKAVNSGPGEEHTYSEASSGQ